MPWAHVGGHWLAFVKTRMSRVSEAYILPLSIVRIAVMAKCVPAALSIFIVA